MEDLRARVAYLQGLAEGLDVEATSAEGRILSSMIDVLGEMADRMEDVAEAQEELAEYVEDVDFDLGAVEEQVYEDEEEADEEIRFIPASDLVQEEDGVEIIACPQCGETLAAGYGDLETTDVDLECPTCGCVLQGVDLVEIDRDGH